MHHSTYIPPAAPARAIPPGEQAEATRIRVCVQVRAALQELEAGPLTSDRIRAAETQLKAAQRVLFVAKVPLAFPGVPAHVRVGASPRDPQAAKWCVCGAHLALEMERDARLCAECQAQAAGLLESRP
jgi:hypothetical protein